MPFCLGERFIDKLKGYMIIVLEKLKSCMTLWQTTLWRSSFPIQMKRQQTWGPQEQGMQGCQQQTYGTPFHRWCEQIRNHTALPKTRTGIISWEIWQVWSWDLLRDRTFICIKNVHWFLKNGIFGTKRALKRVWM